MDSQAREIYMAHKLRYAKIGIFVALVAGAASAWQAVVMSKAMSLPPFAAEEYTIWVICVASLISGGICDIIAGIWVGLYNLYSGRGVREYKRLFKTKTGMLITIGALLGGPCATGCYMIAINMSGPTYAAAISSIYPMMGTFLGAFFLKERLTKRVWIGTAIAIAGALIVGYAPPEDGNFPYFSLGICFAVATAIFWTFEGLVVTYANDMADPDISVGIYRTFISGLGYLVVLVPVFSFLGDTGSIGWYIFETAFAMGSPVFWIAIAAVGAAITYTCFYTAMNMTGVGRAMCLNITMSIWSIVYGMAFSALGLMEYAVTGQAIGGVLLIVVGAIFVVANPKELLKLRKD